MLIRLLILTLLLGFKISLKAQSPSLIPITDKEGLPSNTIYSLIQAQSGVIWLATESGIFQYDGVAFERLEVPASKARSVAMLHEDQFGRIWFQNFSNQIFYSDGKETFEFKDWQSVNQGQSLVNFLIRDQSDLFVALEGKVLQYEIADQFRLDTIFEFDDYENEYPLNDHIELGTNGSIWGYSTSTFFRIDRDQNLQFLDCSECPTYERYNGKRFGGLLRGRLLVFGDQEYLLFRSYTSEDLSIPYRVFRIEGNRILPVKNLGNWGINLPYTNGTGELTNNEFWIATKKGLWIGKDSMQSIDSDQTILRDEDVGTLMQDREGNIWIGTLRNGLFLLPNRDIWAFGPVELKQKNPRINCITFDQKEKLFLGMNSGRIGSFNINTFEYSEFSSAFNFEIQSIFFDTINQHLHSDGLVYLEDGQALYKDVIPDNTKDFSPFGNHMVKARGNGFQVIRISESKTDYFDEDFLKEIKKENIVRSFDIIPFENYAFPSSRTRAGFGDELGERILIAYESGLFQIKKGVFSEIQLPEGQSIYANDIGQCPHNKQLTWVATMDQGVLAIKDSTVIARFTRADGLPSNYCRRIMPYRGKIWVGTDRGLAVLNYDSVQYTIDRKDGLLSNEIMDMVIAGDRLWVASNKGLNSIPLKSNYLNDSRPSIRLERVLVDNVPQKFDRPLSLKANQNEIEIWFKGISFRSLGEHQYRYRLLGFDSTWQYTSSRAPFSRFSALSPGDYSFEVETINEDEISSIESAQLSFSISRPFQRTPLFFFLVSLFGILAISTFFLIRLRVVRGQNELAVEKANVEKELRASQLSALKVQMNPHFIFNAMNSIQDFIFSNEKVLANEYIGKFADLMRSTLDVSNKPYIRLSEEIKILNLYLELESIRFSEPIDYSVEIAPGLDIESIHIPPMLIQPYAENAIKHGLLHRKQNRKLYIRISSNKHKPIIHVEVEDNGIGRKQSLELKKLRKKSHQSFGSAATKKRLDLLNYGKKATIGVLYTDLYNDDGIAIGTKVALNIPHQTK